MQTAVGNFILDRGLSLKQKSAFALRLCCLASLLFFLPGTHYCQSVWLGVHQGAMNYQGELRSKSFTYKGARYLFGADAVVATYGRFDFQLSYAQSMLSGSDAENRREVTRRRNLHFETTLHELSISSRWRLRRDNTATFTPYLSVGTSIFRVNPYTNDLQGKRWSLFPLSTEGQGLPEYPQISSPKYMFLSIPLGTGFEFRVSRHIRADIDFLYRKTFTDRIDDVGGVYPDENILISRRGFKALDLSYRTDEISDLYFYYPMAGTPRGNPKTKDGFYSIQCRIRFDLISWNKPLEMIRYIFRDDDWAYRF